MVPVVATLVREIFRREQIPVRQRWWFAAEATSQWIRLLEDELHPSLGGRTRTREILRDLSAPMFRRRYRTLWSRVPALPDPEAEPRAVGFVFGVLYRTASNPRTAWIFDAVGGAPESFADHLRAERWTRHVGIQTRWEEVTCHLGELLVALTEGLPAHMPRANAALGELCFAAGVRYGKKMKRAFELGDGPAEALEVLRMSEYVFRVNPEHWSGKDDRTKTGFLEGTACPWFSAEGWTGAHCGIFGQFQSGIASVFGLRYHLTNTIPKHGGTTCRIDVKPIPLRRKPAEVSCSPSS